jgi:hypothetical protein
VTLGPEDFENLRHNWVDGTETGCKDCFECELNLTDIHSGSVVNFDMCGIEPLPYNKRVIDAVPFFLSVWDSWKLLYIIYMFIII